MSVEFWKKCSVCKKDIGFNSSYYVCSVSTCNAKRTGLVFCDIPCFEAHLPSARHKEAFAYEETSPTKSEYTATREPVRRIVKSGSSAAAASSGAVPRDVLVVASKLKEYIRAKSDMSTSNTCMAALSDFIRRAADDAIDEARARGRKTVLDRDFKRWPGR